MICYLCLHTSWTLQGNCFVGPWYHKRRNNENRVEFIHSQWMRHWRALCALGWECSPHTWRNGNPSTNLLSFLHIYFLGRRDHKLASAVSYDSLWSNSQQYEVLYSIQLYSYTVYGVPGKPTSNSQTLRQVSEEGVSSCGPFPVPETYHEG